MNPSQTEKSDQKKVDAAQKAQDKQTTAAGKAAADQQVKDRESFVKTIPTPPMSGTHLLGVQDGVAHWFQSAPITDLTNPSG